MTIVLTRKSRMKTKRNTENGENVQMLLTSVVLSILLLFVDGQELMVQLGGLKYYFAISTINTTERIIAKRLLYSGSRRMLVLVARAKCGNDVSATTKMNSIF